MESRRCHTCREFYSVSRGSSEYVLQCPECTMSLYKYHPPIPTDSPEYLYQVGTQQIVNEMLSHLRPNSELCYDPDTKKPYIKITAPFHRELRLSTGFPCFEPWSTHQKAIEEWWVSVIPPI